VLIELVVGGDACSRRCERHTSDVALRNSSNGSIVRSRVSSMSITILVMINSQPHTLTGTPSGSFLVGQG
jgi:hypothetical protein